MPTDDQKLYEEIGQAWRHFASWREKIFAGYLTVLAALGIGFSQVTSIPVRAAIFAGGILVSAVFWILDFRNAQLINACQAAGDRLERGKGCYGELNRLRFDRKSPLTYGLAISLLVGGVGAASVGGLSVYMVRWWGGEFSLWAFIIAVVVAVAVPLVLRKLGNKQRSTEEAQYRRSELAKGGAQRPAGDA